MVLAAQASDGRSVGIRERSALGSARPGLHGSARRSLGLWVSGGPARLRIEPQAAHRGLLAADVHRAPAYGFAGSTGTEWVRLQTGFARSAARRSGTGSRSASTAASRSGTSRSGRTTCPRRVHSAPARCVLAAPPAARDSRRRSRSNASAAERRSGPPSSSAFRFAADERAQGGRKRVHAFLV